MFANPVPDKKLMARARDKEKREDSANGDKTPGKHRSVPRPYDGTQRAREGCSVLHEPRTLVPATPLCATPLSIPAFPGCASPTSPWRPLWSPAPRSRSPALCCLIMLHFLILHGTLVVVCSSSNFLSSPGHGPRPTQFWIPSNYRNGEGKDKDYDQKRFKENAKRPGVPKKSGCFRPRGGCLGLTSPYKEDCLFQELLSWS